MLKGSEQNPSNIRVVCLSWKHLTSHSIYSLGIPHFLMLWTSLVMSTLGKVLLTLRKRAEVTWFFLYESLNVFVSRWMESMVVQSGHALKWLADRIFNISHIVTTSKVRQLFRRQASPFERTTVTRLLVLCSLVCWAS